MTKKQATKIRKAKEIVEAIKLILHNRQTGTFEIGVKPLRILYEAFELSLKITDWSVKK